jgi:hypothetical protein
MRQAELATIAMARGVGAVARTRRPERAGGQRTAPATGPPHVRRAPGDPWS